MSNKLLDLSPKLSFVTDLDLELSEFNAVAVPVAPGEKPQIVKSRFLTVLDNFTKLDLNIELTNWPEFTAKAGEIIEVPLSAGNLTRIYLVGIGEANNEDLRKSAASLGRKVKSSDSQLLCALSEDKNLITTIAVALVLSNYQFSLKSEQKGKKPSFTIYGEFEKEVERADVLATAVWQARDLIHTPSNIKNPEWLAKQASALVSSTKNSGLSITVKSGRAIKDFGGLVAVGNSSPKPGPRLVEVLKRPYDAMIGMKSDMAGAAAVLTATVALAKTKPKVRVTTLLMVAENALSGTSQRPSDVIKHYGGNTVEVINTDAEGRLVLADGLAYADLNLDPDYVLDVATLTGAATLGLGRQYAAMYTRNTSLAKKLSEIGDRVGEKVWRMPLVDDYSIALSSDVADFNHTADKYDFSAGSITAALFLEEFAGDRAWVHLDIAGTGRSEVDAGENIKGGTGFAVRLLIEWLDTF